MEFDNRIDQYVRNKLSPAEAEALEVELMGSVELQKQLEATLCIQRALATENRDAESTASVSLASPVNTTQWRPLTLAACAILAIFSTFLFYRSEKAIQQLENEISVLSDSIHNVFTAPVEILRSSSSETPDLIFQLPEAPSLVMFEIELTPAMAAAETIQLVLKDDKNLEVAEWETPVIPVRRTIAAIPSSRLEAGIYYLLLSNAEYEDQKIIEIR